MCGLAGGIKIGKEPIDVGAIRSLIILNESRGRDSIGLFCYGEHYAKQAVSPTHWLKWHGAKPIMNRYAETGGIFCHTRGGTRGGAFDCNAHPFIYGEPGREIILSHNGVVDAPATYAVDSMWMADLLSQHEPGNYHEALKDVKGWFALTWLDRRTGEVFFLNWDAQLAFVEEGGVLYYSSNPDHLKVALSPKRNPHVTSDEGEVWCWNGKKMRQCKRFKGTKRQWVTRTYDPLDLVGNICKMPNGVWYASLRGPGFVPLKYQDFWEKRFPGASCNHRGGSRYIWTNVTPDDLNWKGVWVNWEGNPLERTAARQGIIRPLGSNGDTELEDSEIVVVDQAGVSDRPLTEPSAGDGVTSAGTEDAKTNQDYRTGRSILFQQNDGTQPDNSLVKKDMAERMIQAEDDDAVLKALALQEEIDRMASDRDHECPPGVTKRDQERLRGIEASKLRDAGYSEAAIDEILFRRGYFDPTQDDYLDPDVPPKRLSHYSYR